MEAKKSHGIPPVSRDPGSCWCNPVCLKAPESGGANADVLSSSLKPWRAGGLEVSVSKEEKLLSPSRVRIHPSSAFLRHPNPCLLINHPHWQGKIFLCSVLIHVLISSRYTHIDTLRNDVVPIILAPLFPVT